MPKFNIYWMYAILLAFLAGIFYLDDNTMTKPLDTIDPVSYTHLTLPTTSRV